MNEFVVETQRQLLNLLRIGIVSEVDTVRARCRVQSEGNLTTWLPWLSSSAVRYAAGMPLHRENRCYCCRWAAS